MADSPECPSRRPSNSSSTAPRLQYPTFPPLSASVEEWLSRSRPTTMTSAPPSEHSSSTRLLSESWATLSVSDAHSEDGTRSEQTDIGSLIDQTSVDDVASLDERSEIGGNYEDHEDSDDDDDDDDEEEESEESEDGDEDDEADEDTNDDDGGYYGKGSISESQELPALYHRFGGDIEDSSLTAKAAFHQSTDSIEFVEPDKWPEVEQVELKHTVQVFEGVEAARLKEQLPPNQQNALLTATVQQTMTRHSLDIDQPFRVLYIGNPDFRTIVLDKIGDVLVSSSCSSYESSSAESSRYHVIPTSFGADAVPNFAELLPIHVQLVVDECLEASSDPRSGKPSTVSLKFKNRPSCTSSWTGNEYRLSSSSDWTLPDVAIFFMSSTDDAAAVDTRHQARTFMERHGVPAMVISEKPLWEMTTELVPINHHSLHMCLESRRSLGGEPTVLRRYPTDLPTFESITPSQLNRNLASLATLYPKHIQKVTAEAPKSSTRMPFFDIEKYSKYIPRFDYPGRAHDLQPFLRLLAITAISAIAIVLGYSVVNAGLVYLSQLFMRSDVFKLASPSSSNIPTNTIIPVNTVRQNSLSVRPSSAGEIQLLRNQGECRTQLEELMDIALSSPAKQGKPDKFELQVIGDSHVILKPPRRFSTVTKKQPKFSVSVTRYGDAIPYELSRLFEGVYSLNLDREDAYGFVNVTITTSSKPPIEQTTQVDFGTPWLKIANWKRAAAAVSTELVRDLNSAQTGLSKVYDRLFTDLQVAMDDVVKKSHFLRQEADDLRLGSTHLPLEMKNAILARSKQLSETVRRSAVQPFWAACSVFQEGASKANTEAKDLMSSTWSRISSVSTPKVDLGTMMDRFRDVRKSEALNKAQNRARGLMKRKSYNSGRRRR